MFFHSPSHGDMETDVFIAGSGPIGATFAKMLVDAGHRVIMAEIGAADSFTSKPRVDSPSAAGHSDEYSVTFAPNQVVVPGYHKKNEIEYQKDIDRFVNVIKGALSTVSVPTSNVNVATLDPASFQNTKEKPFISLGKNPAQNPFSNLGAEAVTRGVGGMTTHWTCATPRLCTYIERPILDTNRDTNSALWDELYDEAEKIIGTSRTEFEKSIRHNLVLRTYQNIYKDKPAEEQHTFLPLPLACHRMPDPDYVEWHATDRILETLFTDGKKKQLFTLLTNHRCTRVIPKHFRAGEENEIEAAEVKCLLPHAEDRTNSTFHIRAKVYIVACGSVATAQVLANSNVPKDFQPPKNKDPRDLIIDTKLMPNLGTYITEQPMTFCQVVLDANLINSVPENPFNLGSWWDKKVNDHREHNPEDPIPIPFRDPEPQVTIPFSKERPWHVQIHRDAFSYGGVAENIDTRLIVDYRWFGYVEPRECNKVVFQQLYEDAYGMPQPTFHFEMSEDDRRRARDMMADMCSVALKIGGYLPGSEPQFMTPGLALHLAGTVRAGLDEETTVANTYSQVHKFPNLYVGGNGVIETGFGANPTLTSLCYAIRSANSIIEKLKPKPKA